MNQLINRLRTRYHRMNAPPVRASASLRVAHLGAKLFARSKRPAGAIRRVVHISPAYFSAESYIGGGERYPLSLASAMAERVKTTLVSFGTRRQSYTRGPLSVEIYPVDGFLDSGTMDPCAFGHIREIRRADVVHCHQSAPFVTTLAIFAAAALRRRCVVTDLGGGGWNAEFRIPSLDYVSKFCTISRFAIRECEKERAAVIGGGVDPTFLNQPPAPWPRKPQVLFVGRLLPHKGIDNLIEAVPAGTPLKIIGSAYHQEYFDLLVRLAAGKQVTFLTRASDQEILAAYRESTVSVLPSVYTNCYGQYHPRPELLGLVLLESMASGTAVVCTDVGGMPEYVAHGRTGLVVPPNNPPALRAAVMRFVNDPDFAARIGAAGRAEVEKEYTWQRVVDRTLEVYRSAPPFAPSWRPSPSAP
jgi:glycosyltransferase involved in cell wall biosynthesis